jgi:uncharacterized protein YbjT (DUF2867 family)
MIVITTPTGGIGRQVLNNLLDSAPEHGEQLRVIVRDAAKLSDAVRDRVDIVQGSHGDPDVIDRAFDGADAVFWLAPPNPHAKSIDATYSGFTQAAARAFVPHGISHVVGVSALGRGTAAAGRAGLVTASLAMDDLIGSSGVAYRALANAGFMDNMLRQVASIRDNGVFTNTDLPDRKAPLIATRDIARTGAGLLLDRSWSGVGSVPLIGPEDLSQNDVARITGEVLGTSVRYERQRLEELAAQLRAFGMGEAMVHGMVDMMRAKDEGVDDGIQRTPESAGWTTYRQWCEEVLKPAVLGGKSRSAAAA